MRGSRPWPNRSLLKSIFTLHRTRVDLLIDWLIDLTAGIDWLIDWFDCENWVAFCCIAAASLACQLHWRSCMLCWCVWWEPIFVRLKLLILARTSPWVVVVVLSFLLLHCRVSFCLFEKRGVGTCMWWKEFFVGWVDFTCSDLRRTAATHWIFVFSWCATNASRAIVAIVAWNKFKEKQKDKQKQKHWLLHPRCWFFPLCAISTRWRTCGTRWWMVPRRSWVTRKFSSRVCPPLNSLRQCWSPRLF